MINMKKYLFWIVYAIFTIVLLVVSAVSLRYVENILVKYEEAQPEKLVEKYLEEIQTASLPEELEILQSAKELTYKVRTGSFSETEQQFNILADGEVAAVITLESVHEEVVFEILTMCDWEVKSVDPIVVYHLRLPKSLSVFANGDKQMGVLDGEEMVYTIYTIYETLELEDAYGTRMEYANGDSIYTYDYTVKIPDNFSLTLGGEEVPHCITGVEENPKYQYCAEYTDMPKLVTYEFGEALGEPKIEICNNKKEKLEYTFEDYKVVLNAQKGEDTVPAHIAEQVDVLKYAKRWSKFMSNDLEGSQRGFLTMAQYLVEDSYLYEVAYRWAHGIDITYTAYHRLDDPAFTEEKVSNYVDYGNGLFSCDISFVKHMYLIYEYMTVTDVTNSTFYFMYLEDTDAEKGRWVIVDIQEIIEE